MTAIRLLLNSGFTGANAFFAIADARGLFREAGLEVAFTPGRGAYTAAGRLAAEGYDAAYGDLNALIELAAGSEAELPIAVFMAHEHAPSTITVAGDGPIRAPADLGGCKLIGHVTDVALRCFPAFARAAGLADDAVAIEAREAGMTALLDAMLAGEADGVFGYMTTHTAALRPTAPPIRFLRYRDSCPALYGSALMVSPRLLRDRPDAVAALIEGMRRGIAAAAAEPEAAIDAVIQRNPSGDRRIELERWRGTLHDDMGCAAGLRARLGDVEDHRLDASIDCLARASGWSRIPSAQRIYTRRFLAGGDITRASSARP